MANKKTRQALGRGLSNLIPIDISEEDNSGQREFFEIETKLLHVNPFQTRYDFNEEDIKGLAESIEHQGLLQPVVVRKKKDIYEIISGERRFRALKLLRKDKIPCILKKNISDKKMLELALVENIQRENLNEIEIAQAYKKLLLECSLSHKELSERIGKSRSVITNYLRLLKLPEKIQKMLRLKKISMGHARALLSINSTKEQCEIADKIISERLSVRDIENWNNKKNEKHTNIYKKMKKSSNTSNSRPDDPDILFQEEQLRYHFGSDVKITMNDKYVGKIEVAYYNKSDLERILNIILL
jgi:ParB family chromosome partitioning protein